MNKTLQESFNRFLFFFFDEAERIRRANITSSRKQLYWFSANQRRYAWRGNQRVETWCCRTSPYQVIPKDFKKMVSIASLLGTRRLGEVLGNKPESSLVVSLGKALNETSHLYMKDRWPRRLGNGNSQASADVPFKI